MDAFEILVLTIDRAINTKRKRHIIGGVLLSVSLLFGGLAFTVMTIKMVQEEEIEDNELHIRN